MPIRKSYSEMTVASFHSLNAYKGQRRTEKHAALIEIDLKHASVETLDQVAVIHYWDDRPVERVDGNSRDYLWDRSLIPIPSNLKVTDWWVDNEQEAREVYNQYNSDRSKKTARDESFSAMRLRGYTPKSAEFRDSTLKTPLMMAEGYRQGVVSLRNYSIYEALGEWISEVSQVDEMMASGKGAKRKHSAVLAAAFMSLRVHGDAIKPFWQTWFSAGWEGNSINSPNNRLYNLMLQKPKGTSGSTAVNDTLKCILWLAENYLKFGPKHKIAGFRYPDITRYLINGGLKISPRKEFDEDDDEYDDAAE